MTPKTSLESLVMMLGKLPGVGRRSARRLALELLNRRETLMIPLAEQLLHTAATIKTCAECGNWDDHSPCHICSDPRRDKGLICVVEQVADLWAMERGHIFNGVYHILGGTLSAMDGRGPDQLRIAELTARIQQSHVREVILATNATVEGQTTAHYLMDRLQAAQIPVSQLAQGIPLGGELDYLDEATLGTAIRQRQKL